jgi:hypothetical protein
MDAAEFEQNILKLAFETDVRITTASVAYYLGIPSEEAQPMLDDLLEQGVLELESDRDGNLYYRVADAAQDQAEQVSRLRRERLEGVDADVESADLHASEDDASSGNSDGTTPSGWDDEHLASVDDGGDAPAITPTRTRSDEGTASPRAGAERGGSVETAKPPEPSASEPVQEARASSTSDDTSSPYAHPDEVDRDGTSRSGVVAGVTRQPAATDARLDTCGSGSPVVTSEASCDPQPFADSRPVLASCAEESESQQSSPSTGMMQPVPAGGAPEPARQTSASGAGARGGAAAASRQMTTYTREDHLEKPEHQPGMSLLLSLILCGTGQIYNGEVSKGIMMMVLCFLLWFVLLGWVVHIWSIVDSVVVAERINRRSSNTN